MRRETAAVLRVLPVLYLGCATCLYGQARDVVAEEGQRATVRAASAGEDLVVEDTQAALGLYSRAGRWAGSAISLWEVDDGVSSNKWSIWRSSTGSGGRLHFSFGSDPDHVQNPDVLTLDGTGRVGVGTTTPQAWLHLEVPPGVSESGVRVLHKGTGNGATFVTMDQTTQGHALAVTSLSQVAAAARIQKVGQGLALEVLGTAAVDVLEIRGADLAERFPVSEPVTPGLVLAIDPRHPGQLRVARGAYNRRVAGVVSGANDLPTGAILGHLAGSERAPAVALSGRVWVKCDAAGQPIRPGDLLTTSDLPGHAMKVTDHALSRGAILGKAMTSLERGQGLVLALVTLQ